MKRLAALLFGLSVIAAMLSATGPASAVDSTVSGSVTSANGPVTSGYAVFYRNCKAYANSDATGSFEIVAGTYEASVPDGTYYVLIDPDAGAKALRSWNGAKSTCDKSATVEVAGDNNTLNLTATAATEVTGLVMGESVVDSGYLYFYASCEDYRDGTATMQGGFFDGAYSTTLPAGSYRVLIEPDESDPNGALRSWHSAASSCADATPIIVTNAPDGEVWDLTVATGAHVTGQVFTTTGTQVMRGDVSFYEDCAAVERGKQAANDYFTNGTYEVNLPDNDSYIVMIRPRSPGALASWNNAAQACADADAIAVSGTGVHNLTTLAGAVVTGTVTFAGGGTVDEGEVSFFATCDDYRSMQSADDSEIVDGAYSVTLPNGTYRVYIEPSSGDLNSWHNAKASCRDATVVTVSGNTTQNLVTRSGVTVSGTVMAGPNPVEDGAVYFYATCEDYLAGDDADAASLIHGTYSVTVMPGTYRVYIGISWGEPALDSWHNAKATCEDATVVTVSGDSTLDLNASPGWSVSGDVTSTAGPVDDGGVYFYTGCEAYLRGERIAAGSVTAGRYSVKLPSGTYRALISPGYNATVAQSWHAGATRCADATPITIDADSTTLDLTAASGSELSGFVTRNGDVLRSGTVYFYATCEDFTNNERVGYASISEGYYEATLADGDYLARINQYTFGTDSGQYSWHSASKTCAGATAVHVNGESDENLIAPPTSSLSGTVDGPSGPISGGYVDFYATCQDFTSGNVLASAGIQDGTYTAYLPDGAYLAHISPYRDAANSWHDAAPSCDQADPVTVSGVSTADLNAARGAQISGSVTSTAGSIGRGEVTFYATCEDAVLRRDAAYRSVSRGAYRANIIPGTYRVFIEPGPRSDAWESWNGAKASCEQSTVVSVAGDDTVNLVASGKKAPDPDPTPPPDPTPTPQPTPPTAQSLKKPPAKVKKGKKAKLAKKTTQGAKVTWKTSTKKVCTVKKYKVTAKKKGTCKLSAKAPARPGFTAFSKRYTIRIR